MKLRGTRMSRYNNNLFDEAKTSLGKIDAVVSVLRPSRRASGRDESMQSS